MDENLLSNFREIVLESAKKASEEKISRQEEKIKNILEEYEKTASENEERLLKKAFADIEEKYRSMAGKSETESRKELINKREEMEKEIYDMLLLRLAEFSASEEYKTYLKIKAVEAVKIACGNDIIAEVREADVQILDGIVRECRVSNDIFGGARFIISKKGIIVDNTLKSAAEDVMADFNEIKIS